MSDQSSNAKPQNDSTWFDKALSLVSEIRGRDLLLWVQEKCQYLGSFQNENPQHSYTNTNCTHTYVQKPHTVFGGRGKTQEKLIHIMKIISLLPTL